MNKNTALQRKTRIRKKASALLERPRLSVHRSNKYCSVQIVDTHGKTLLGMSEKFLLKAKKEKVAPLVLAKELGIAIAKKALDQKIKQVVFDKGGFAYHGRVKAVAQGAREGGLNF